ncbi:MAG: MBL fold metallo-hydrolase [Actinomycetota bacterium]|nr:MBL fold metallo-hydrolase [Actinomycetota bacterium]
MNDSRTRVVLLGTGTPRTEAGRAGTSTAVIVDGQPYIFDFGPGVGLRLSEGYQMGITGLAMSGVARAFLTHMHSDHTAGLAALVLTPWMFGREEPLEVRGPQGTAAMTRAIASAYALDVAKRSLNEPHTERGHEVIGTDVVPGIVYKDDLVEVEAFEVQHGDWDPVLHGPFPAMGYRVTTPDRIVVISGDTGAFPEMADVYAGCDVLVHEVYATAGLSSRPPEWQSYHSRSHTSGTHLGRVAAEANPGVLVLAHQLLWHATEDDLIDEVIATYAGPLVYGRDLTVI